MIINETNRGIPAAANQGIAAASGRQIVLLNNDVVVTTGWLFRLLRAMQSDPAIGLVGPCSNFVSGPQQVEIRYDSLADLDGFAWDWGGAHEGQRVDVDRLVGFCPVDLARSGWTRSGCWTSSSASAASRTTITACGRSRRAIGQ